MSILNSIQSREYNRAQKMQIFFAQQSGVFKQSTAFDKEVHIFFDNNRQLQSYVPIKKERGDGITIDKSELKTEVAEAAAYVCGMTTAYAIKTNNNDLKNGVNYTESAIEKMKDGDILGFVSSIVSLVTPLLSIEGFTADYSITADTLSKLTEMATAFNSNIGKAIIINNNSGIASRNINKVLAAIRANIVQFDHLIAFFKKKYPDFVTGYRDAIRIDDTGIRHSGIEGIITNSSTGAPVTGVTITAAGTNKKVETNDNGAYRLIKFRNGNRAFTFTAPGYDSQTVTVSITRGKIRLVNLSLQSKIISLAATA